MKYKAINKKTNGVIYFDDDDMHNPEIRAEWQVNPILIINDPEAPDSLNKLMLLERTYNLFVYAGDGHWQEFT